jgi:hypothetical protein
MTIGVVVERRRLKSAWADHAWAPAAVLPGAPDAPAWTVLDETPDVTRFYAGAAELEFFSSDTATYRDNLRSGSPSLWIALRDDEAPPGVAVHIITADPAEGEGLTESGASIVEAVPMPVDIQSRLAAFVAAHHVERIFHKRKRERADPEALGVRPAGGQEREGER